MPEPQKPNKPKSRIELMKEAIAKAEQKPPVAAAATNPIPVPKRLEQMAQGSDGRKKPKGVKPKSDGPKGGAFTPPKIDGDGFRKNRSAKARDERHRKRGRLPDGSHFRQTWNGMSWQCELWIVGTHGTGVKGFNYSSDGLFRALERLDVMFWEWYSTEAPDDVKAKLKWSKSSKPQGAGDVNAKHEAAAESGSGEGVVG